MSTTDEAGTPDPAPGGGAGTGRVATPEAELPGAPAGGGRRLALGGLFLACLALAVTQLPVQEWLQAFMRWSEGLGPTGPLVLIVAYVLACVLMFPGSLITLGAGAVFGLLVGFVAASIGSTLGAGAAFLVGRTVARGWVEERIRQSPRLRALDEAVAREGFQIVLLTRLSPVFPFNLLNFAYGATRVRFRDYILASWIGMIPGTLMYVYLGSVARDLAAIFSQDVPVSPWQQALRFVGLLATIGVTVYVTRVARRALDEAIDADVEVDAGADAGEAGGDA